MKPYYNPKTKETYRKSKFGNIEFRMITGMVEIKPLDSTHSIKITKNEFGETTNSEVFNSHYVCCGVDYCNICGKKLTR